MARDLQCDSSLESFDLQVIVTHMDYLTSDLLTPLRRFSGGPNIVSYGIVNHKKPSVFSNKLEWKFYKEPHQMDLSNEYNDDLLRAVENISNVFHR